MTETPPHGEGVSPGGETHLSPRIDKSFASHYVARRIIDILDQGIGKKSGRVDGAGLVVELTGTSVAILG